MSNIKKHSKDSRKTTAKTETRRSCEVPIKKPTAKIETRRSCEVPIKKTTKPCTIIKHPIVEHDLGDELAKRIYTETANKENKGNYDEPVLNTLLDLDRQMKSLQLNPQSSKPLTSLDELSPRSKANAIPEITRKLNFPPDKTIFKNLIPINVNDSILMPKKKTSIRKKYMHVKHPEPDLCDFLDPMPPLDLSIPEPEINIIYPTSEIDVYEEFLEFFREVDPNWIPPATDMLK